MKSSRLLDSNNLAGSNGVASENFKRLALDTLGLFTDETCKTPKLLHYLWEEEKKYYV